LGIIWAFAYVFFFCAEALELFVARRDDALSNSR
jgi:hypothetical protein